MQGRVLALVAFAFLAPLAGCLSNPANPGNGTPTVDPHASFTKAQAASLFQSSLSGIENGTLNRLGMHMKVDAVNASTPTSFDARVLFDKTAGLVIMSIQTTGEGASGPEMGLLGGGDQPFIVGQVWKTSLLGTEKQLFAIYNETASPPTSWTDVKPSTPGGSGGASDPSKALKDFLVSPGEKGIESVTALVYEKHAAMKVVFDSTSEQGARVRGEAVLLLDKPERIAYVSGTIKDPTSSTPTERDATFRMDFTYDADATHPLEKAAKRLEGLAMKGDGSSNPFGGSPSRNFTIEPSHAAEAIPLTEVEARAYTQAGENDTLVLALPLDQGSAENAQVRLVFEDKDGNARVSAGDVVRMLPKSSEDGSEMGGGSFTLKLFDETTGLLVLPAPGVLLALAALATALVLRRRA